MKEKPRLAMYWASACGGCEVSLLNIGDKILMVDRTFDIVFFPCIADFKLDEVQSFADGHIDLCLFNGAIRSSENEEMARLLRRKSKVLVAYGSCAHEGCIPALANLTTARATFDAVYLSNPANENPEQITPQALTRVPEGEIQLPAFYETVMTLDQVVKVEYSIPGCPPEPTQIWDVLESFIASFLGGGELPAPGSVLGAKSMAVCEECPLERREGQIKRFYRPHEIVPDPNLCLLEQGLLCMGIATRAGCGALCPQVSMGCRGCYGPPDGVEDQAAKMLAAVASVMAAGAVGDSEEKMRQEIESAMSTLVDPAGTFYRFSLAHSLLQRARATETEQGME
jgi:F420-non-reducing hydrogenase small subunit